MWLANQDNQPTGKSLVYNDRQLLQPYSLQQERKNIRSYQHKSMHPLYWWLRWSCHSSCWRHQFDTSIFGPEMWRAHRPLILHHVCAADQTPSCLFIYSMPLWSFGAVVGSQHHMLPLVKLLEKKRHWGDHQKLMSSWSEGGRVTRSCLLTFSINPFKP